MNTNQTNTERDDVARMMMAKGDEDISRRAFSAITGSNERNRQISFNIAALAFLELEETTEQERAAVARFVKAVR